MVDDLKIRRASAADLADIVALAHARLFEMGPEITRKEWFVCVGMVVLIMLGTINIRMAEMKARRQGTLPLIDPEARSRK